MTNLTLLIKAKFETYKNMPYMAKNSIIFLSQVGHLCEGIYFIIKLTNWAEKALHLNPKFENKARINVWLIQIDVESNQPS